MTTRIIIAVGRLRAGPEYELQQRYLARLRPAVALVETSEQAGSTPEDVRKREAAALLAALPDRAVVVALDETGAALTTETFAQRLQAWREAGRAAAFLIGGAEGLSGAVLSRADYCLSLGPLTFPHLLARVILCEQLYRAQTIVSGHPYHRGRRAFV